MSLLAGDNARVFLYPSTDTIFRANVETLIIKVGGQPFEDAGILAAVEALLLPTYPLAQVQARDRAAWSRTASSWDIFRDSAALDGELLRRARAGQAAAVGQLYDRHAALAYAVAVRLAGPSEIAARAVVSAFQNVIGSGRDVQPSAVRLLFAKQARIAALTAMTADEVSKRGDETALKLRQAIVELARLHRLSGTEIALVLDLDVQEVRRLANDATRGR